MRIAAASPPVTQAPKQNSAPATPAAPEGPKDEVVSSDPTFFQTWGTTLAGAAVGVGAGMLAGSGVTGSWGGGIIGLACGAGLGVAGTVGAARAGLDEQSMKIGGIAAAAGAIAGAVIGSQGHSALAGAALAVGGALGGGLIGFSVKLNEWMK